MGNFIINSFILVVITCILFQGTNSLPNEYCRARPTLVALDHPKYDLFPFFVMLHRCGGSCGNLQPTQRECVAVEYNEVEVMAFSPKTGTQQKVKLRNHTRCGEGCVAKPEHCNPITHRWDGANCDCQCMYNDSDPPKGTCGQGFIWNRGTCRCECGKVPEECGMKDWSKDACGCVCSPRKRFSCRRSQYFDNDTCTCKSRIVVLPDTQENPNDNKDSNKNLFIGLLIGESIALIILLLVLLRKKCQPRRPKGPPSPDYVKSPITGSAESLNFPENTDGKSNTFVTTEVAMVSETDFVTRII